MGSVRKLPVQYYVTKKTTGPLQTKTSEKTTPLPVKFFDIKSKNDHLIQVSQEILELSKTIKYCLKYYCKYFIRINYRISIIIIF